MEKRTLTITVDHDHHRRVKKSKKKALQALHRVRIPKKKSPHQAEIHSALAVTPLQAEELLKSERKGRHERHRKRAETEHAKRKTKRDKTKPARRVHRIPTTEEGKEHPVPPAVLSEDRIAERDHQAHLRRQQVPDSPILDLEPDILDTLFDEKEIEEMMQQTAAKPPEADIAVNEIDVYLQELISTSAEQRIEPSSTATTSTTVPKKRIRCRKCHGRGHHHSECTALSARQLRRLAMSTGVPLWTKTPKKVRPNIHDLIPRPPVFNSLSKME